MFYGNLLLNDIESTAEEVNLLINSIDESYLQESSNEIIEEECRILTEAKIGIINFNEVSSAAKDIVKIIKTSGIGKESRDRIRIRIDDMYQKMGNNFMSRSKMMVRYQKLNGDTRVKFESAWGLVGCVCVGNMLTRLILKLLFGAIVGDYIATGIVVPINEENAKQMAVKGGFIKEYTIVFNSAEFAHYLLLYSPTLTTTSLLRYAVVRGATVSMHLLTTIIQWLTNNETIRKAFGIVKGDRASEAKLSAIGKLIGYIIHIGWNLSDKAPTIASSVNKFVLGN